MAQWGGDRWTNLIARGWAYDTGLEYSAYGTAPSTPETGSAAYEGLRIKGQLDWILYEMDHNWFSSKFTPDSTFMTTNDPILACSIFCEYFEGCEWKASWDPLGKCPHASLDGKEWQGLAQRRGAAQDCYNRYP